MRGQKEWPVWAVGACRLHLRQPEVEVEELAEVAEAVEAQLGRAGLQVWGPRPPSCRVTRGESRGKRPRRGVGGAEPGATNTQCDAKERA